MSSRVSFAGPGRGPSPGPPEDDVDLSVLHALGRSGCFSWGIDPHPLILHLRTRCRGGSVGVAGWWGLSAPMGRRTDILEQSLSLCPSPSAGPGSGSAAQYTPTPLLSPPVEKGAIRRRKPPGSVFLFGASPAPPATPLVAQPEFEEGHW